MNNLESKVEILRFILNGQGSRDSAMQTLDCVDSIIEGLLNRSFADNAHKLSIVSEYIDRFRAEASKHIDALITGLAVELANLYTDDEVKMMQEFYSTEMGQKILSKMGKANLIGAQVGKLWGDIITQKIEIDLEERLSIH